MNAAEKNPMLMMSSKTLGKKIADALAEGRRAGIEEAIGAVHTARKFPVSGQPASHVFDVVEAVSALLEAKT